MKKKIFYAVAAAMATSVQAEEAALPFAPHLIDRHDHHFEGVSSVHSFSNLCPPLRFSSLPSNSITKRQDS